MRRVPEWALEPIRDFLDHHRRLFEILHISARGIGLLVHVPRQLEALRDTAWVEPEPPDYPDNAAIARATAEADLARHEVSSGFPLLHANTAVALCSALEALVRTFLANWIANRPDAMAVAEVAKLRVRIGDYEAVPPDDRAVHILDLLEESLGTRRGVGVARFESLFAVFDLSSPIPSDVHKRCFELYQVRNNIVHRRGIADRRLIDACPWLGLTTGAPVVVTHAALHQYGDAVSAYVLELIQRVRVAFGVPRWSADAGTDPAQISG